MHKIEVAKNVADKLFATEHAVDEAMVSASRFLESMVEARRELNLSAVAGEVATSRVAEAISALSEARRSVMAAHGALANLQSKMGMGDNEFGQGQKPDQESGVRPALRVAASQ
ncbi:hypothetical protein [Caulobacter sp. 17J80-11]|uniref:hypothetical protein n=1 Tax=Caulobacter sp. 17J80-11 TaxID=2763502 RepID=UPI001653B657|nr:hypothetical protein [Caulobacter sp. 17J80-11]MBC6983105.1 hypothetical protein [Caulobacter sp. 17J80-11]